MTRDAARTRGALPLAPLLLLLAGLVLLALGWLFLADGGPAAPPEPAPPPAPAAAEQDPVAPATLGTLAPGVLPGEGDLRVELRWLGAKDDAREAPQLPGRMEGVVLGPTGQPVAGARLTVVGGPQDGRSARTDADGFYSLGQLLAGTHFFALEGPSLPRTVTMQRVLARAATRRDFAVGGALPLRIMVKDSAGKALAGAEVLANLGEQRGVSGEDGVALLENVPAGPRVLVDLRAAGHVPVRYEVNFHGGGGGAPIELPPLPKAGALRVAVRSWPGGPTPSVTVVPRATGPGPFQPAWETWQDVATDREGLVELTGLPTTHLLDVRVTHPMGTADPPLRALQPSADFAAVAEFVVRRSSASVEGLVVDEGGTPVPGARATVSATRPDLILERLYPGLAETPTALRLPVPGALRRSVAADAEGRFRIAIGDHPEGTGHLVLTVEQEGFRPARVEVRTATRETVVRLVRAARASGLNLVRRDGGDLPDARFVLDGAEVAGADGASLGELWPGFYEIAVMRGTRELLHRAEFWIEGATELDLSP